MWRAGAIAAIGAIWASLGAAEIRSARYDTPTDAYGHGVVPGGEYGALVVRLGDDQVRIAPRGYVFEDTAPRLVDLNGDGAPEVVAVASGYKTGAELRIYGARDGDVALLARSAPIGRAHRWLAVAGVVDLDGDGAMEIAYVDRPHLARVLTIYEVREAEGSWVLRREATAKGHTNHRIGDPDIAGGIRRCAGAPPEILTLNARWDTIYATAFTDGRLRSRKIGPYRGAADMRAAFACQN